MNAHKEAEQALAMMLKLQATMRALARSGAADRSEDVRERVKIVADYLDRAYGHMAEISHGCYFAQAATTCAVSMSDYCDDGAA